MDGTYAVVTAEWCLFTEEQARNFGPDVIAMRCKPEDYGHNAYDGLIRARSIANDGPRQHVTTFPRKKHSE